ncbi:SDR family oxidoreductase [Belnapia sp. T6]|uniref:SDR family oxidoreductase n=1 Tax=Belnapia mucosa TaxID=2804532 RepID=A0ABS1UY17_9PROT|nr:SDR family NAD(P)-dependent oxidoreductase [Belnapia mucosa]MBL6454366.1 SDR family oxidoreductase [Belnapia mucosa]
MQIRFDGTTVAVTGAGHGFGREIARRFAELGARVFACDLSEAELAETATGTRIETAAFDLTAPGAAAAWVQGIERATGGAIGVLASNAGGVCGQTMRPVEEVPEADWHAVIGINLHAHFLLVRAAAPAMKAAGQGAIITTSSGAGLQPSLTGIQAYTAAKHGLVGLTKQLARELGPHGIRVNSVAPGLMLSNPASIAQWEGYGEEGQRRTLDRIALKRLGTAADIADAVLFLASDRAGFINGQVLSVDGGR